jgi:hypothetical protein
VTVWPAISRYSVGPVITLHSRTAARQYVDKLGNQAQPMFHALFPNNDAVFLDDNAPVHTAGNVQPRFQEHEAEPAQSPHLNIIDPFWSVLETTVRSGFHIQHL